MVVYYNAGAFELRKGHKQHKDDSDITLNIVLNDNFQGGDLSVKILGPVDFDELDHYQLRHEFGNGLLHYGRAPHWSDNMFLGERYNLVLWFKAVPVEWFKPVTCKFGQAISIDAKHLIASFFGITDLYHFGLSCKEHSAVAFDKKRWFHLCCNRFKQEHADYIKEEAELKKNRFIQILGSSAPPTVAFKSILESGTFSSDIEWHKVYNQIPALFPRSEYFNTSQLMSKMVVTPEPRYASEPLAPLMVQATTTQLLSDMLEKQ